MYWFWYFLYATQPAFLLMGLAGILGEDAKRTAHDVMDMLGIMVFVLIILMLLTGLGYLVVQLII